MTNKKHEDEAFSIIMDLVNDAFNLHYDGEAEAKPAPTSEEHPTTVYESIEDYTNQTGKRFRMTKRQKELGYTREEAFEETFAIDYKP